MTNQEQYELICEKAEKYDRLVGAIEKIRAKIQGLRNCSCSCSDGIIDDIEDIIDKYMAESENK